MSALSFGRKTLMVAASVLSLATAAPVRAQETTAPPEASSAEQRQAYDDYQACRQKRDNRALAGAVIGGIFGALFGSGVAAHGVRTEGSVLGGGIGALGGAAIGADSARCDATRPQSAYDDHRYERRDYAAADGAPDDRYAYDRHGRPYPVEEDTIDNDGCGWAQSQVTMPDGQVQDRQVRVCRDLEGHYQVVD